ncbi:MAG: restriction endonuclease [Bosea sp.]|nr:restriction endonuclease [Bosea sp. (in: a-proteobacteria)]
MGRRGSILMAIARDVSRAQRQAEAARVKAAHEHDRYVRAQLRDEARQEREALRSLKEQARFEKEQYLQDREQQASDLKYDVEDKIEKLNSILTDTLSINDQIDFSTLRIINNFTGFSPPRSLITQAPPPTIDGFLQKAPPRTFLSKLVPGAKDRHEREIATAKADFKKQLSAWKIRETQRVAALQAAQVEYTRNQHDFEAKKAQRNAEVDLFEAEYKAGEPNAIIAYSTMVLERSSYPEGFPQIFSVAYTSESKQLVVEYQLPTSEVVPENCDYRYVRSQDTIIEKPRKASEIKELYRDIIAATALRTIHELFEANVSGHVELICFNGYIHTVDPATGQDIQPHLISVRTTREKFQQIDLRRVDKAVCLRNLGAQVSKRPEEAQPVKPIIEFKMADARFVDQTDLVSGFASAKNLMELTPFEFEQLVANLFGQMGLESKLTRSSRDGGVDCVAFDRRPVLGGKVVIQAKRYRHTVGVSAVRDLYGTMMNEGANKGILVSTSGYGPCAFDFAKDKPIELIDGGNLLYLLQEVGFEARIIFPEE